MTASHYLVIDQGGHASRAILFNEYGHIIKQASQDIATLHPQAFYVEHEPQELIDSVRKVINDCLDYARAQNLTIVAAGLATQRSSIVCWDKTNGRALSKVISWQDRRAAAWLTQFAEQRQFIHDHSGLYLSAHYGCSKIRWCLDHLDTVITAFNEQRLVISPLATYINFHLCQERAIYCDPANGSRTLLLNIETKDWDSDLINLFNIPVAILPRCQPNNFYYGSLANQTTTVPLTLITGDQSATVFHNGLPDKDAAYINIGTGAFIQRIIDAPLKHCQPLLSSIVYCDDNRSYYSLEGTVNGAGSALSWFNTTTNNTVEWQNNASSWLENPSDKLYFINAVGGIASPYWLSEIQPHFIGEGSHSEQLCAIVESILFLIYKNLTTMEQHLSPAKSLIISGGFSQSNALCQHLANLSQTIVIRPQEKEATARGLCFLVNKNKSHWQVSPATQFQPTDDDNLQQRYQRWRLHMETLIPTTNNG